MNARELHALRRCLRCACCGEPIGAGERYYELPDGMRICAESDCLADWAADFLCRRPAAEDEEDLI